jgi:hypothetical protein
MRFPPEFAAAAPRDLTHVERALLVAATMLLSGPAVAMGLTVTPQTQACHTETAATTPLQPLPAAAKQRIPDSLAVAGRQDLAWVWLGSPTRRYPHGALGSPVHAGSVHALVRSGDGRWQLIEKALPLNRVFEDRIPRLADLDRDGRDEIVLIESDTLRGASLVVLGVAHDSQPPRLVERARGPHAGSTFRWLNPVGVADFDGDGSLDLASVTTPHVGGVLELLHYRPPALMKFASAMDVSNHRMGALEQSLAVVVEQAGHRPTLIVPDMTLRALHALRWEAPGRWTELADLKPMSGRVERLVPAADGACATLDDGRSVRVTLTH